MYAQKGFQTSEPPGRKMAQCVHAFYSLKIKVFIRIHGTSRGDDGGGNFSNLCFHFSPVIEFL